MHSFALDIHSDKRWDLTFTIISVEEIYHVTCIDDPEINISGWRSDMHSQALRAGGVRATTARRRVLHVHAPPPPAHPAAAQLSALALRPALRPAPCHPRLHRLSEWTLHRLIYFYCSLAIRMRLATRLACGGRPERFSLPTGILIGIIQIRTSRRRDRTEECRSMCKMCHIFLM